MKKRNLLLLLLLLIAGAVAAIFLIPKNKKGNLPAFTQQGQTAIPAGNIELKVWDNNAEDGDVVSVYFDGKLISDSLAIWNDPAAFKIGELGKGEHWIGIKAISEGSTSPASVSASLSDGKLVKEFIMNAWIDTAASWKVVVE